MGVIKVRLNCNTNHPGHESLINKSDFNPLIHVLEENWPAYLDAFSKAKEENLKRESNDPAEADPPSVVDPPKQEPNNPAEAVFPIEVGTPPATVSPSKPKGKKV